jgi:hypothetical protein
LSQTIFEKPIAYAEIEPLENLRFAKTLPQMLFLTAASSISAACFFALKNNRRSSFILSLRENAAVFEYSKFSFFRSRANYSK